MSTRIPLTPHPARVFWRELLLHDVRRDLDLRAEVYFEAALRTSGMTLKMSSRGADNVRVRPDNRPRSASSCAPHRGSRQGAHRPRTARRIAPTPWASDARRAGRSVAPATKPVCPMATDLPKRWMRRFAFRSARASLRGHRDRGHKSWLASARRRGPPAIFALVGNTTPLSTAKQLRRICAVLLSR